VLVACVAMATAGSVRAQEDPPPGFSDGHWQGTVHWQATLTGEGLVAQGLANGSFEVQWSAGAPIGVLVGTGSGESSIEGGGATLTYDFSASFGGNPSSPVLVGDHLSVSGIASAEGFTVPVDFTLGAGELGTIPLDVRAASCTTISGDFQSHVADISGTLAGAGVLSAPVAFWSAVRTGDGAALSDDQKATMNELLAEADVLEQGIAAGSFDGAALLDLLYRAEQFSYSLSRGADCGRPPGAYAHVLSGMVARILDAMIASSGQFDAQDWQYVVLAAAASGVIGPGSGAAGAGYVAQLVPIMQALIDLEYAAGDATDLFRLALVATTLGDEELRADALAKFEEVS
jgi:hypothetical protein